MKRSPINRISKKQIQRNKELAKIVLPEVCSNCGKLPDFRGIQKHHKIFRSHLGGDTIDNIEFLCGTCHGIRHGVKESSQ